MIPRRPFGPHSPSIGCALSATVYVDNTKPADCSACGKTAAKLMRWRRHFDWECSAVECPTRKTITAQQVKP